MQYSDLGLPVGANSPRTGVLHSINFFIDGSYAPIVLGPQMPWFYISPFAGTITGVTLIANTSGLMELDIWKCAAGSTPTEADSITAYDLPALNYAQSSTDTTLTGWTTSVAAGDVFAVCIIFNDVITSVSISLAILGT